MNNKPKPENPRGQWTSASNAQADSLCPGRHLAQEGLPDTESKDAAFGTAVHSAVASDDDSELDHKGADIAESIREIEANVTSQYFGELEPTKAYKEERLWTSVDFMGLSLEHSGQPDLVLRLGTKALILEYKTLPGDVPSSPTNLQLRDQVVLVHDNLEMISEIAVAVVQPLVTHKPELCIYSAPDIDMACLDMAARVIASNSANSPCVAGELQCKFCKAKRECQPYQAFATALVPHFLSIADMPVDSWSPQDRATFCERRLVAEKWLKDCTAEMRKCLEVDPECIPGWFLKKGAERQSINDPEVLFTRFLEAGGSPEQFMKCVKVTSGKFAEQVGEVTQLKGKSLKAQLESMKEGIVDVNVSARSLSRKT